MSEDITSFNGQYRFLSNFYPAKVCYQGYVYPTVEHAYQAAKCLIHTDLVAIRAAVTPGDAKRLGNQVPLPAWWEITKIDIMRFLLIQKFIAMPLTQYLWDTNPKQLIEGNTWGDTFWGVCNGRGENHLGKLLMEIRRFI